MKESRAAKQKRIAHMMVFSGKIGWKKSLKKARSGTKIAKTNDAPKKPTIKKTKRRKILREASLCLLLRMRKMELRTKR